MCRVQGPPDEGLEGEGLPDGENIEEHVGLLHVPAHGGQAGHQGVRLGTRGQAGTRSERSVLGLGWIRRCPARHPPGGGDQLLVGDPGARHLQAGGYRNSLTGCPAKVVPLNFPSVRPNREIREKS